MAVPGVANAPRSAPNHFEEHVRLAQAVDSDLPRGIVAYKYGTTAGVALTASYVELIRLSNVPLYLGRLYAVGFAFRATRSGTTAGGYQRIRLYIGATLYSEVFRHQIVNSIYHHIQWETLYSPAADETIAIYTQANTNSTGSNMSIWTEGGGHLRVEDVGSNRGKQ